jgi:hypothetical protein
MWNLEGSRRARSREPAMRDDEKNGFEEQRPQIVERGAGGVQQRAVVAHHCVSRVTASARA